VQEQHHHTFLPEARNKEISLNILSVHNRYLFRGGEDESSELENALLRARGHNVIEHIVDNHDIGGQFLIGVGLRSVWNPASYSNIRKRIRHNRIDLVKIDNFFPQISPAVFYAAHVEGTPTVQTLRNFRLLCPGATFFRDGKVCEDCTGKAIPWPGVVHGCYRKSSPHSLAPAAMSSIHKFAGTWRNRVSAYVVLSEFSRRKFIQGGLPDEKIFVKPNFVTDCGVGNGEDKCALFVGRLSPEKGLDVLLAAWRHIGSRLKLKIVGTGPLEDQVREHAAVNRAVEYLGQRPLSETYALMGRAMALIFPSKWYETFGRTVAESFAKGTPVIASNLGTMQTMVTHKHTGLHFDPGQTESLVEQVEWMLAHPNEWLRMRQAARRTYEEFYTPERNYDIMMQIYSSVLSANANASNYPGDGRYMVGREQASAD
jgi:glycosyltransferase involved in cell wall biosynthesis